MPLRGPSPDDSGMQSNITTARFLIRTSQERLAQTNHPRARRSVDRARRGWWSAARRNQPAPTDVALRPGEQRQGDGLLELCTK